MRDLGSLLAIIKLMKIGMKRILKFVMKVVYNNEKYAKYGYPSTGYFIALMAAVCYILLTAFMFLVILASAFPTLYKFSVNISKSLPAIPSGILAIGVIFILLRISIKENELKDGLFTKDYVNKAVNYLIAYVFVVIFIIGFFGMKFLRHYKG